MNQWNSLLRFNRIHALNRKLLITFEAMIMMIWRFGVVGALRSNIKCAESINHHNSSDNSNIQQLHFVGKSRTAEIICKLSLQKLCYKIVRQILWSKRSETRFTWILLIKIFFEMCPRIGWSYQNIFDTLF